MTQPLRPTEISLLRTEVEAMGEILATERIDRKAEEDRIRIELEAIKKTLADLVQDFESRYQKKYAEILQNYDPETLSELPDPSSRKQAG